MNLRRERASQSTRNPAQISDPNPSDLEQYSPWTHGRVDPVQESSYLLFEWQFFLSNKFLKALMSATHSFIVWSVARALWSSVVIFQNPLFLSSPVDPLSFQLFIPSHSNMADGQNPAHSSPIQLHTHTLLPVPSEWKPLKSRAWLWQLEPG